MHQTLVQLVTFVLSMPAMPSNDDCSAAQLLSGGGPFSFDTTLATTGSEGQANYTCGNPTGIERDVWFAWTAPASGPMVVDLCGSAGFDTKIAVYSSGGCPSAVADACNDDACGLQSQGFFQAAAGNTYSIQIGSSPGGAGGTGTFTIHPGAGECAVLGAGPDIILGDIVGVVNAPAAGGLDAVAFGTTACNVGDAPLNWFAPTNQHPVVATNVHRFRVVDGSGRMEQIGMSWLKHGFGAAVDSLCCACQNPLDNQMLGIGCSDTYDAALNGTQGILGPRWQVDAHSGVFTFPPANPSWSGPTARRCEIALSDLATGGGARFFAEGAYVTADDALAGNNDNNESCRELLVVGGPTDYTLATTGDTQRRMSAVQVWATLEPGVVVTEARVPREGLFHVGSNATSLGNGTWRYEYAVHNVNSDRSCGTFSVPIPAGAAVTNIGFHDVAYRNGDGPGNVAFDGADWSVSTAGGALTWSTQSQAQNARANAIRWATTYNFRFDADVAPASGLATLDLWKSGTPGSIAAAARVPSGGSTFAYCFGDGLGTPCPCGNHGAPGAAAGCVSSLGTGGSLAASGTASVSADTFTLLGASMPNAAALYFQGTLQSASGAGTVFGDGLRCAAGTIVRLTTKTNSSGASTYPQPGDVAISVRGGDGPGDVRTYQCWYRNAAAFCQPATFNLTNGIQTTWQP